MVTKMPPTGAIREEGRAPVFWFISMALTEDLACPLPVVPETLAVRKETSTPVLPRSSSVSWPRQQHPPSHSGS